MDRGPFLKTGLSAGFIFCREKANWNQSSGFVTACNPPRSRFALFDGIFDLRDLNCRRLRRYGGFCCDDVMLKVSLMHKKKGPNKGTCLGRFYVVSLR